MRGSVQAAGPAAPEISVAVCTRNRCRILPRLLESLRFQECDRPWEVLVVDNASEDATRDAAESIARGFPVPLRVVDEPRRGLSHARNRALAEARGRVVVYVDDDATCRPGWLRAHAAAFAAPDVVASGGRIVPVLPAETPRAWAAVLLAEPGGPTGRYDYGSQPRDLEVGGPVPHPFGGNMGVLRALALELGGFRADLGWGTRMVPGEETELLLRMAARGGRMLYAPAATIDHHLEGRQVSVEYFRAWQRGYGRFFALVLLRRGPVRRAAELARQALRIPLHWRRAHAARRRGDLQGEAVGLRELERSTGCVLELLHL
jgi:glycosyltransferase involved in cell wall biosynthesis